MAHNSDRTAGLATTLTVALLVGLTACAAARTPAQSPAGTAIPPAARTAQTSAMEGQEARAEARERGATGPASVWDGVYTEEQAAKGRDIYRRVCNECHGTGEAPAIVGNSFIRRWFDDGLDVPFIKIRRTMPDDAPGMLSDEAYLDTLSYMLESAGLPAGLEPLTADLDRLAGIKVVEQGGVGAVPNFSLVQVMGCLMQSADGAWALTNSTNPLRTREPGNATADVLEELEELPLGTQTLQLQTVQAQHLVLRGHKVQAKGILMRNPAGDRINVTNVQSLSDRCTP